MLASAVERSVQCGRQGEATKTEGGGREAFPAEYGISGWHSRSERGKWQSRAGPRSGAAGRETRTRLRARARRDLPRMHGHVAVPIVGHARRRIQCPCRRHARCPGRGGGTRRRRRLHGLAGFNGRARRCSRRHSSRGAPVVQKLVRIVLHFVEGDHEAWHSANSCRIRRKRIWRQP